MLNVVQQLQLQLLCVVQQLYPDKWPNFFSDMLVARSHNPVHANMFTRVLLALDADIISLDIPRSDAESRRSMAFKDAMRERDVGPVVHACVEMVAQQHRDAPHLVIMVLSVLQRYADWVDIHLVVTQDFVSLLYQLLRGVPFTPPVHVSCMQCICNERGTATCVANYAL